MQKSSPPSNQPQSNWPFLVIAVLMAIVLWLFVRTGAQPLGQRIVYLPVTITNAGSELAIAPNRVEVRLEAASGMAEHLSPEEVSVIADLSGHKQGDLVPLTVVPPQGFKVLSTSVTSVRVVDKEQVAPSRGNP